MINKSATINESKACKEALRVKASDTNIDFITKLSILDTKSRYTLVKYKFCNHQVFRQMSFSTYSECQGCEPSGRHD